MKLRRFLLTQKQLQELAGLPEDSVAFHAKVADDNQIEITVFSPEFKELNPGAALIREAIDFEEYPDDAPNYSHAEIERFRKRLGLNGEYPL